MKRYLFAVAFAGSNSEFAQTVAAMWDAVDNGEVTRELVNGVYREAGK